MRTLLFLLVLFPSLATAAVNSTRIDIVNAPSQLWEERIYSEIDRTNRLLCRAFTQLPDSVRVFRSDRGPQYDLSLGMIFIGHDYLPVHLYHEYGHKVLDHYLYRHSSVLSYYQMRDRIGGPRSLQDSLLGLEQQIREDQGFLIQLRQRRLVKMAGNLSRWINDHTELIFEASAVMHLEERLAKVFEQLGSDSPAARYRLLAPYHELFADTLAVIMTGRWQSVMMAAAGGINRQSILTEPIPFEPSQLGFNSYFSNVVVPDVLHYRSFQRHLSVEEYRFSRLEGDSNYAQFAPVRSYIRGLAEQQFENSKAMLLLILAEAIQQQLELRLSEPKLLQMDLKAMNRGLIDSLQQRMANLDVAIQGNCRSQTGIAQIW
ncbi:MAG: hypothetical protein OQJ91_11010 [Motiliproteus sp.]|nr:hypothetical protein [Motiliproteus sp.]